MEDEALIDQSKDDAMPDLPTQPNPVSPAEDLNSASDSDSDSDSEDDEAQNALQLQTLENELSLNPSNYDAHFRCINLLRKMGDIDKLRRAREAMSELFPLTPSMWQDWARDESALIAAGTEAFHAVEKLYERGVSDYLSVSLWRSYVDFVQEYDVSVRELSAAGISKARDLFERALTATGLHVAEGNSIWEAYREFEQAIYLTIDETDTQARGKQVQRIRSLFQRQLSVPLIDSRSTLLTYKAWEVDQGSLPDIGVHDLDGLSSHVASTYQKTLEMYNAREQYEERISKDIPDMERFQEFKNYLKFEQSSGDPARVQILYERAITYIPISADLWIDYTRYLDRTLKIGSTVSRAHSRAIKNCPWVPDLWVRYMLSLERNRAAEKEIAAVYEKALGCTFSNIEEYLELYLTRVDGLRRRIVFANDVDSVLDFSLIRETFKNASDYLTPHLKNTDSLLRLHAYWASLELNLGKNLVAMRDVWEALLKNCGSMLEAWLRYISIETELGNIKEARTLYKRCYTKRFPETGSADICHSWLRFEKEHGTLDDLDLAAQKVSSRLEELELFRLREESKLAEEREIVSKKTVQEKRKSTSDIGDEYHPTKRQKESEKKKVQEKPKPREHDLTEAGKVEAEEHDVKIEHTKESLPQRGKVFTDQCTVFISNLNYKATSDDLRNFFSDVGGVVAIRVLRDKFTKKSRGLAYVDFSDDEHVEAAVKKNRSTLLGKILSIAKSNPKHGKRDQSSHNRQAQDKDQSHSKTIEDSAKSAGGSFPSTSRKTRLDNIQLIGKNTFAVPRNVAALSQKAMKPKTDDDKPKSNDEFRQMLPKG